MGDGDGDGDGPPPPGHGDIRDITPDTGAASTTAPLLRRPTVRAYPVTTMEQGAVTDTPPPAHPHAQGIVRRLRQAQPTAAIMAATAPDATLILAPARQATGHPQVTVQEAPDSQAPPTAITTRVISEPRSRPETAHPTATTPTVREATTPTARRAAIPEAAVQAGIPAEDVREEEADTAAADSHATPYPLQRASGISPTTPKT